MPQPTAIGLTRFVAFGDSLTWGAQSSFDPRFLYAAANGGYVERRQAGLNAYYSPSASSFQRGRPVSWCSTLCCSRRFRNMLTSLKPEAVLLSKASTI